MDFEEINMDEYYENLYNATDNDFIKDYIKEKFPNDDIESNMFRLIMWGDCTKEDMDIKQYNKSLNKTLIINADKIEALTEITKIIDSILAEGDCFINPKIRYTPGYSGVEKPEADLVIRIDFDGFDVWEHVRDRVVEIFNLADGFYIGGVGNKKDTGITITINDFYKDLTEYKGGN